jgi:hypothetical protein
LFKAKSIAMKKNFLFIMLVLLFSASAYSQPYKPFINIPVKQNNKTLVNPWTGGIDSPIIQQIDLNGDGIKDLFIFEKTQSAGFHRWTTYLNYGTPNQVDYHYAPEYQEKFPQDMHDWVLLVDFDCDGKEDLITYNYNGGFSVYRNDYTPQGGLKFTLYIPLVYSSYWGFPANLFVASVNQPAFSDIDNDGDLDLLTFALSANNIEFHRNYAMENYNRCDTLVFQLEKSCWGFICLSANSNTGIINCDQLGLGCQDGPNRNAQDGQWYYHTMRKLFHDNSQHSLHSGSCMLAVDLDGDGDKDVLNGDILGNNMLALYNGGTIDSARIITQDTAYPVYSFPVNMKIFPAPYILDVNNDGFEDFLATPCIYNGAVNIRNVYYYKNAGLMGSLIFSYQGDSLLVNEMIDVGSGANVTLADLDGDGLKDMIIGNFKYVYQSAPDNSKIAFYRNTGTATQPEFTLITDDLAGFSASGVFGAYPTFGDLDNDGDLDMIIGASDGFLHYYMNTAGAGNMPNFTLTMVQVQNNLGAPINMGAYATPTLIDLNRDGLLDLVIGERNGNLNYFQNTGTPSSFQFTLITQNLGGVSTVKPQFDLYGFSAPFFRDNNGSYELYCGSLSGFIYKYDNIDNNLSGTFNLVDSMFIRESIRSTIAGADINNDGFYDFVVGNYAGGVIWYSNAPVSVNEIMNEQNVFILFPNPASTQLTVMMNSSLKNQWKEIIISDLAGRVIYQSVNNFQVSVVDISGWSKGMYVCSIKGDKISFNRKFIINR